MMQFDRKKGFLKGREIFVTGAYIEHKLMSDIPLELYVGKGHSQVYRKYLRKISLLMKVEVYSIWL